MRTKSLPQSCPQFRVQTGIVLSTVFERSGDHLQLVRVGQDGAIVEAYTPNNSELDQALEGPLRALTLQFIHGEGITKDLPLLLLGLTDDPFVDGFTHLPETACPEEGVVLDIKRLVATTQAPPLRRFLMNVFERRDVFQTFWTMPASARHHHARPGGLAVHSLEVARDIEGNTGLSDVELDLGIAGALLHDIGKVWSYTEDMFPNAANLAMGHELVGLSKLEAQLTILERAWPDGAYAMRCLLSGHTRMRENGSLPTSLLPRIKACDQRSCERDRSASRSSRFARPIWTPRAWDDQPSSGDMELR